MQTYDELILQLKALKSTGRILDYLIESDFAVKNNYIYVKCQLTIFNSNGKPSIMTALMQGNSNEDDLQKLQQTALLNAYEQNEVEVNEQYVW